MTGELTRPPFFLCNGRTGELFMFVGEHPNEERLVRLWPGDYLTETGVRFPAMQAWDGIESSPGIVIRSERADDIEIDES